MSGGTGKCVRSVRSCRRNEARLTGTATGVVSVVGYTPDIFVSPVAGYLLDRSPGVLGHQHFFAFMAVFAAAGIVASVVFSRLRPPTANS